MSDDFQFLPPGVDPLLPRPVINAMLDGLNPAVSESEARNTPRAVRDVFEQEWRGHAGAPDRDDALAGQVSEAYFKRQRNDPVNDSGIRTYNQRALRKLLPWDGFEDIDPLTAHKYAPAMPQSMQLVPVEYDPFADQSPQEENLYQHHLGELYRGGVRQPDGSLSTLYQAPVEGPGGRYYNVPTVWDGQILTTPEARERAAAQGWNKWPSYATPDAADLAYEARVHPRAAADMPGYEALRAPFRLIPVDHEPEF